MTRPPRQAPSASTTLGTEDLQRFSDFLYRRTGMLFGESKRYYIDRRVSERQAATGMRNFSDYFAKLRSETDELELLINAFTVNETYFYREEHQLRCLSSALLPALVADKKPGDRIRIWSNPCSTGEEPFSIAIWLLENWPLVDAYNIEIIGSDIDTHALEDARVGDYDERALSRMPADVVDRYFEPRQNGTRRIIQDIQESVSFSPVNLIDAASMTQHGLFDVVFCRNVLIYFDDESRLAASHNLRERLRPGGFICLGHSESMTRISDRFDTRRFEDAIVYQRPVES
ncbi:MAG TPA: protein-glutamate O-methyltransferase CheR [Aliidongia sp.]|uniref:CheR family methyltransferase n=1 Tax=Aliidongia sp. TaxID=1914230 RepID=UPI002DDD7F79|nr:protein-glutamate O-methyltransferase CheR [Aliidongia sp.]HEV2673786.1 protein-glutamate O-methyltransferase CheR [Aliidongia sp.]